MMMLHVQGKIVPAEKRGLFICQITTKIDEDSEHGCD